MSRKTPLSEARCPPGCQPEPSSAAFAFLEPCFSLARQTCEPRDELIDCSVEIYVHRVGVDVTPRQSQPGADGKHSISAGFFAEHHLRGQDIGGKARNARDFFLDEVAQHRAELDVVSCDVDR